MASPKRFALSIDGHTANKTTMDDPSQLVRLVYDVAEAANMTILNLAVSEVAADFKKLGSPVFEDEGGISILALIYTSHIALHCWPERKYFMFDLVSCRPFNEAAIRELVEDELELLS